MTGYVYRGTQAGDKDPWQQPKPVKRARTKPVPRQTPPCGTYAGYKHHYRHGEKCDPCWTARRQYDRDQYRAKHPKPNPKGRPPQTPEQAEQTKTRRKEREQARRADPQWRAQEAEKARARYADPEHGAKRRAQERARYWRRKEQEGNV